MAAIQSGLGASPAVTSTQHQHLSSEQPGSNSPMPALVQEPHRGQRPNGPIDALVPSPRLPNELLAYIVELVFLSSSPTQLLSMSFDEDGQPLTDHCHRSTWNARVNLLLVNKMFHSLAKSLLYSTIHLGSDSAANGYFGQLLRSEEGPSLFSSLDRAWFGNISAAQRSGHTIDPVQYRLKEAAWYEETAGGFIIGHSYASRPKRSRTSRRRSSGRPKTLRRVSVYWAEEEILEEVSDTDSDGDSGDDDGQLGQESGDQSTSSRSPPAWQILYASNRRTRSARDNGHRPDYQGPRRRVAMSATLSGPVEGELDPWDMVAAQERLTSLTSQDTQYDTMAAAPVDIESSRSFADSASSPATSLEPPSVGGLSIKESISSSKPPVTEFRPHPSSTMADLAERRTARRQKMYPKHEPREIVAYHLVTATLENWINQMLSEIKTLRYITLTFYPGILLDDDKLEHVLRRILSADENPRLERLLVRIAHEPVAAGSRFRRLDRAMTIGGAVDRIGDDRVHVEGLSTAVGGGMLSQLESSGWNQDLRATSRRIGSSSRNSSPSGQSSRSVSPPGFTLQDREKRQDSIQRLNEASRRALRITEDGWWARILQQNRSRYREETFHDHAGSPSSTQADDEAFDDGVEAFSSLFGAKKARTMRNVLGQADPFRDAARLLGAVSLCKSGREKASPAPTAASGVGLLDGGVADIEPRTGYRQLQLEYINSWARRGDTNAAIEE